MGPDTHGVVIVDDDCLIIETLRWMVEDIGFTVRGTASTADAALAVVRANRPAVVLMDVRIRGGADGIEVAQAIAREFPTPVIFITGSDDQRTLDRIHRVRPAAVLIKPVHIVTLAAAIRDAIPATGQCGTLRASATGLPHHPSSPTLRGPLPQPD